MSTTSPFSRSVFGRAGSTTEQSSVFDDCGNLTSLTTGGATKALGVNAQTNRLTGQTASYDPNGNLTGVTVDGMEYEYQYNPQNQMRYLQSERTARIFIYDANDERVWTWTCPRNDCVDDQGDLIESTTMRFTMRGLNGEVLRVWEGTTTVGRNWVEDYVHLNGRPIAAIRNTATTPGEIDEQTHFFMVDHLGSVRQILDESGNQVGLYEYYPFGQEKVSISNAETLLKFTGHERDEDNLDSGELDYMHARYCSPVLGRFLSVDPLRVSANRRFPSSWNRYTYARNEPMRHVDRDGRDATVACDDNNQCTVTVRAQIVVDRSNPKSIIAGGRFAGAAERYWNGRTVEAPDGHSVTFDVDFTLVDAGDVQDGLDTLTVVDGVGTSRVEMVLDPDGPAPDTGVIFTRDDTGNPSGIQGIAPHEAGHLMGLRDLYFKGEIVPVNASPEADIMRHAQPTNGAASAWWAISESNRNSTRQGGEIEE